MVEMKEQAIISQADLDELLHINEFIEQKENDSLVAELKQAILDSGKLELEQWEALRDHLREIEELIPHIDLIIKLKANN
jgi:CTP synthase (UTP-ammonia lyase)